MKLGVKDLLQWKMVSKYWFFFINSPSFIVQHLEVINKIAKENNNVIRFNGNALDFSNISEFAHEILQVLVTQLLSFPYYHQISKLKIGGWCNGFLCLLTKMAVFLWNPETKETKIVHYPLKGYKVGFDCRAAGFGFDSKNNDCKIVMVETSVYRSKDGLFRILTYSLKKGRPWKWVSAIFKDNYMGIKLRGLGGRCIGGMCSWILIREKKAGNGDVVVEEEIMSVDISSEVLIFTPLPSVVSDSKPDCGNFLTAIDGSLAVINGVFSDKYSVWILGEYGVKKSWRKLYTVGSIQHQIRELPVFENRVVLEAVASFAQTLVPVPIRNKCDGVVYESMIFTVG